MVSYRPVIVGINQYEKLQPLLYAQFDALELRDFLISEAGLPPQQCALLADVAPMVYSGAAFPSRRVLWERLQQTCDQAGPEDLVWFFFSGYGVYWQGQDYILPIEADLEQVGETGLPLEGLLQMLAAGAHRSLVTLDIHRPQAGQGVSQLGLQTLELAKSLNLPLILSCQPGQFSQDSLAVRHGFFTEALIEGLRFQGCLTLAQLATYLQRRVPELCQHHFRPLQNPLAVVPADQKFLLVVPADHLGELPPPSDRPTALPWPETAVQEPDLPPTPAPSPEPEAVIGGGSPGTEDRWPTWAWGLILVAGLSLFGVLLRTQGFFSRSLPPSPGSPELRVPPSVSLPPGAGQGLLADAQRLLEPLSASSLNDAIEKARQIPSDDPVYGQAQDAIERWSWMILDLARARAAQGSRAAAVAALDLVPEDQLEVYGQAQATWQRWQQEATNQQLLQQAQSLPQPEQAATYGDAIQLLQQIPPDYPEFAQAQDQINQWSEDILAIARVRAAQGQLPGAIAAAELIPPDSRAYRAAQQELATWRAQPGATP
ncbi:MAG: caspase family protein [Cyanobacteriota bacterium]|nr:caspase family protein [Cyanobacteriota bacterium]